MDVTDDFLKIFELSMDAFINDKIIQKIKSKVTGFITEKYCVLDVTKFATIFTNLMIIVGRELEE